MCIPLLPYLAHLVGHHIQGWWYAPYWAGLFIVFNRYWVPIPALFPGFS